MERLTLDDLVLSPSASLRIAMERMTRNRLGVLFVCDAHSHLMGVISDGDIRRALLTDTLLISPLDRIMNPDPLVALNSEEAGQLLKQRAVVAVPLVNGAGSITGAVVEVDGGRLLLEHESAAAISDLQTCTGALAIIPARGNSKRIPRKNLAEVGGKPLVVRAIEAARDAKRVGTVLVSTDDLEIAEVARKAGATVPWLRPTSLARDDSPSIDVVIHAMEWALRYLDPSPSFALLIEPTAAFRTAQQIDRALELLEETAADCVMTVSEVPHVLHPEEVLVIEGAALRPYVDARSMGERRLRGGHGSVYVANGAVYALAIHSTMRYRTLFGEHTVPLITPWEEFIDIDTTSDLELANLLWSRIEKKQETSYARNH